MQKIKRLWDKISLWYKLYQAIKTRKQMKKILKIVDALNNFYPKVKK